MNCWCNLVLDLSLVPWITGTSSKLSTRVLQVHHELLVRVRWTWTMNCLCTFSFISVWYHELLVQIRNYQIGLYSCTVNCWCEYARLNHDKAGAHSDLDLSLVPWITGTNAKLSARVLQLYHELLVPILVYRRWKDPFILFLQQLGTQCFLKFSCGGELINVWTLKCIRAFKNCGSMCVGHWDLTRENFLN